MLTSNTLRIRRVALFLAVQLLLLLPLTNLTFGQTQPSTVPRLVKFSGSVNAVHGNQRSGVVGLTFANGGSITGLLVPVQSAASVGSSFLPSAPPPAPSSAAPASSAPASSAPASSAPASAPPSPTAAASS